MSKAFFRYLTLFLIISVTKFISLTRWSTGATVFTSDDLRQLAPSLDLRGRGNLFDFEVVIIWRFRLWEVSWSGENGSGDDVDSNSNVLGRVYI